MIRMEEHGGTKGCQEWKDIGSMVLVVREENSIGLVQNLGDRNVEVCNGGGRSPNLKCQPQEQAFLSLS